MSARPQVVVVDGLRDTTEVLRAVFEPRGVTVSRRHSPTDAGDQDNGSRVLVLHDDRPANSEGPCVVVGRLTTDTASEAEEARTLPVPFHYGELIAAIDDLVKRPAA